MIAFKRASVLHPGFVGSPAGSAMDHVPVRGIVVCEMADAGQLVITGQCPR